MWGARFRGKTNAAFEYFSSSVSEDYKLAGWDIRASEAHCRALVRAKVLKPAAAAKILRALGAIHKDLARFEPAFRARKYEDIHSFLEGELVRRAGPEARRIHAGRSRNDQVNQATRLYCKEAAQNLTRLLTRLQSAILAQARRHGDLVVAGYTHLQKAQPILLAHQFLAYLEALERSKERLGGALERIDVLTLGSGALAGTSLAIDRERMRKELGLGRVSGNSLDAVGSRDFAAELLFVIALLGTDLSRIAEDFLIWQMDEHGWYETPESLSTGSSMMPQKRNPDFLELARGAAAVFAGNAATLLGLLKGLPGSYNRDLQWDKRPLFESVESVTQIVFLFRVFFDELRVNRARAAASAADGFLGATDIAELLVRKGVAFREAHERVGAFVRACQERGTGFAEAPRGLAVKCLGVGPEALRPVLGTGAVGLKKIQGGTAPGEVKRRIAHWERRL